MIYITGDTHGSYSHIEKFARKHGLGPADIVVCLGDTQLNYYGDERDGKMKRRVASIPVTLLCVHGNHDRRPETLPSYRIREWMGGEVYCEPDYPSILFAKDASVFDLGGWRTMAIGGAYSIDWRYRLEQGYNWFADEQPSDQTKRLVEKTLDRMGWRVDAVLSHTCPQRFVPAEALFETVDQSTVDTTTERWLDTIEERLDYRRWYCGHFHIDKDVDRLTFLFKAIREFGQ